MSYLTLNEGAAPATPATGKIVHYAATDGTPHVITDTGVDMNLSASRRPNYVRNSGLWFAQRQAPATLTTYSNLTGRAISADGWGITNENASAQYQRVDTATAPEAGLTGQYYGVFGKVTGTGKIVVSQVIEGVDTAALRGTTVRLQLWMKSQNNDLTARIGLAYLTTGTPDTGMPATFVSAFNGNGTDPTLGTNLTYIAPKAGIAADGGTVDGNGVDCPITTTAWARFGAVFDVPSSARNLVVLVWSDSQLATTVRIAMSQVSVTAGQDIQDWTPLPIAQELIRCQRFYSKSFSVDTLPAQNAGLAGAVRGQVNVAGAVAAQVMGVRFPTTLRDAPATTTFFNPSAANAFVRNTAAATDATATASANASDAAMDITFTGIAAWAAGATLAVHYTADAEI